MSRRLRFGFWFALVSLTACARSALPIGPSARDEAAGAPAVQPRQPEVEPEPPTACPPCGEHLPAEQSLRCLCHTAKCPRDLDDALSDLHAYAAYGEGCGAAWFIRRSGHGYDVFAFERRSGDLVFAQHTAGDKAVTCEDGSEQLLLEGGRAPDCSHVDFCRFAHVDFAIGLGELDSVRTCDEPSLR